MLSIEKKKLLRNMLKSVWYMLLYANKYFIEHIMYGYFLVKIGFLIG